MAPPSKKPLKLSDEELAFQDDKQNWRYGPVLCMRFYCDINLDYARFEEAILNDAMTVRDERFDHPDKVILWDESWPTLMGGRFYDFEQRDRDRREPSLIFYPRQYKRLGGKGVG